MNFIKKLVLAATKAVTIILLLLYVPACFLYVISPQIWWPMGILSIGFPYLWLCLLLFVIAWFFVRKRIALVLMLFLLAGLPIFKNVFAWHFNSSFAKKKNPAHIRVMQWNCNGLPACIPQNTTFCHERVKAVAFIKKYKPDIICVQDFGEVIAAGNESNIALMRDSLGYPYFFYNQHYSGNSPGWIDGIGIAIFSKFPIQDSGKVWYPEKRHPESIIWTDFRIGKKSLRLATTHLQSMHLNRDPNKRLEQDLYQDSLTILHGTKIDKLKYFQPYHVTEANYLRSFLDTCKPPLIFTGDLNSQPSSFAYNTIKGDLTDAHLAFGFGFGRSYHSLQPALRIDYIFYSQQILPQQASVFQTTFSDHDPVLMDFTIR